MNEQENQQQIEPPKEKDFSIKIPLTPEKELENVDNFWSQFYNKKAISSVKDYCEMSLEDLECERSNLSCALSRFKAKMKKSIDCFSYNWNTKYRVSFMERFLSMTEKFNREMQRIEDAIRNKKERIESKAMEQKSFFGEKKLKGWNTSDDIMQKIEKIKRNYNVSE